MFIEQSFAETFERVYINGQSLVYLQEVDGFNERSLQGLLFKFLAIEVIKTQ